jgi:Pentapeptide repeats (8 copies)
MANDDDLARLRQGVAAWNEWRAQSPERRVDLGGVNLAQWDLAGANLSEANLGGTNLAFANLVSANLISANLVSANLVWANLGGANLSNANLSVVNLSGANFERAILVGTRVYGISAWDLKLEGAEQCDLVITRPSQPEITVDSLEVAQFIYLLLHNEKIRDVIDTIGKKGVLLLGRFTEGRLAVLERLRTELRKRDFVPMVFNFDKPETKDFTETVRLLAGLSRFVIVDITNPRSAPLELQAAVPEYMIPFIPIIEVGEEPFAMFKDLWVKHRAWVLDPIAYGSVEELVQGLDKEIIQPALARFDELVVKKAEKLRVRRIGT